MKKLQYAIIGAALSSFVVAGQAYAGEAKTAEASLGGGFAVTIASSALELSQANPAKTDPLVTGSIKSSDAGFDGGFAITITGSN